jgi:hypothetical protein
MDVRTGNLIIEISAVHRTFHGKGTGPYVSLDWISLQLVSKKHDGDNAFTYVIMAAVFFMYCV